jgi:hypothetical protein
VGYEVAVAIIILHFFHPIIIVVIKRGFINTICIFVSVHVEVIACVSWESLSKLLSEVVLGHGVTFSRTMSIVGVAGPMVIKS